MCAEREGRDDERTHCEALILELNKSFLLGIYMLSFSISSPWLVSQLVAFLREIGYAYAVGMRRSIVRS